jgi:hypothetical protein
MAMSDQNKRTLPRVRKASGANAAAPDNKSSDWMMSLKAVNPKDRGRNEAARIAAIIKAATAANQILELLLKDTPAAVILDGKVGCRPVTVVT